MKPLNLQFLPLTFIDSAEKIKEQIIHTAVFASLLEEHGRTNLKYYLESTQYGFTASSSEQGDYKFLRITDINHGSVEWNNVPFCSGSGVDKYLLKSNDILVARTGGTTGKSHLVTNPPNNAVFASYLIRLRPEPHTNPLFIDAFLNSYLFWNQVVAMKSGSAQPNVNAEKLKELILPKCDLVTQNRVVGFIKNPETMDAALKHRVLRVIEKYDTLNGLLSTTDWQLALIPQLRQALLREAMQGQMLPQDPTDEPAAVLLQQLQAAAKPGKKGRGQAGALFSEEAEAVEGPFAIPANWAWTTLGTISDNVEYGTSEKASLDSKGVPVLRMNNIQNGEILTDNLKYLPQDIDELPKLFLKTNDLLFNRTNSAELVGKAGIYKGEDDKMTFASYLIRVQFPIPVTAYFTNYFINSLLCRATEIEPFVIQQNGQANFNGTKLKDIRIPLPPLAEQHRIVAKLEQLMQHCDALEQRIRESRRLAEQLLQTALREALAPPTSTTPGGEAEPVLSSALNTPARLSSRRSIQLALGTLLD